MFLVLFSLIFFPWDMGSCPPQQPLEVSELKPAPELKQRIAAWRVREALKGQSGQNEFDDDDLYDF